MMKPFSLEQLASNLPDSLKGFVMDERWVDALNEAWFFLTGPSGAGARYSRTRQLAVHLAPSVPQADSSCQFTPQGLSGNGIYDDIAYRACADTCAKSTELTAAGGVKVQSS